MFERVLVFGGGGLVGSSLRRLTAGSGERRMFFPPRSECDLTDRAAVVACVERLRPDAIIQLAALSGGIGLSMSRPATLLRDNVTMDLNVLEAARLAGVQKTVMSLSVGMYPADAATPIPESAMHAGPPHPSNAGYAFAKRLIDPALRAYRAEYGMNIIGLIPNGIFGEGMDFARDRATMVPALIRRFYEERDSGAPIVVWGDGSPLREYTYAEDMARAYLWCLDHYDEADVLNVGSTEERSVREIAEMIAGALEIDPARLSFDADKPNGQFRRSTDNSRFLARSGFVYTPFSEALRRTVDWFVGAVGVPGGVRL